MAIKKPIPITFNLDSHNSVQSVCAVIHIDDKNTETLDLSLMQGGEHIAVSPNSTVTARFVRVKNNTLISDDIACTVQENGNIYIPIDNAAAHMLVGEIKIEVNIVDENDVLTMQFPLVIRVNNTILADAEICPISKGTIPELIEKAQETADNAQETADNAQQTADNAQAAASTAQQTANSAQTAANSAQQTADNAIAGLGNKQDTLTAGDNITIENNVISAEGADVSGKADKSYVDTELAKKADKTEIPTKISAFTNDVGYLTQHQSLSDYYTKYFIDQTFVDYEQFNSELDNFDDKLTQKQDISKMKLSVSDSDKTGEHSGEYYPSVPAMLNYIEGKDYLTQHQDISGKENTSNKVTTISSSSTDTQYPSAKATKDYVDSSIESVGAKTKEVTQANVNWREGWKDAYNGNELNIPISGAGRLSSTPIWIKKDTVLTVNVSFYTAANTASGDKAYVDLELYDPSDQSANAYGWVNVVRAKMDTQGNITISKDGYYVISVFNCGSSTALINDYGVPYSFSYVAPENFEPNYIFTVDWGTPAFAWITGNSQGSFSNGLNWVCRREIRKPYYLTTTTAYASEKDVGCYYYNTNDFSGTKSSASRQAVLVFGDEIWYFTPSPDGHTGIATIVKFKIYDNGWIELIGHCWHNLGHMNSVSYNPETDTLIFGNGSSSYVQEGEAYIINGFSTSALATSYSGEIVLMTNLNVDTVSLPIATYGYKTNVIAYGVTNKSQSAPSQLVVVLVTNDGNTIRYGTITGTSAGLYQWSNCVWDTAINVGDITETQTQSYAHVVQGITVLNGRIIWGEGHNQNRIAEIITTPSETTRQSYLLPQFFGSYITTVATYKGKLIYCASNEWAFTDIATMDAGISESRVIELINAQISNAIGSSY